MAARATTGLGAASGGHEATFPVMATDGQATRPPDRPATAGARRPARTTPGAALPGGAAGAEPTRGRGPRVSIVVPTKDERANLPRFLATIPPDVELVVCDESADGTPELARELRPRDTVVLPVRGSIAAARQVGAEAASGDVLVFTDADVELAPDYVARLRALPDGWDAVCGPKLSRGDFARYYRLVAAAQRATFALTGIAGASGSNMAMTRDAFRAVGGFRLGLRCNEDTELFLRAHRLGLVTRYDDRLVVWASDHRRLRRGLVKKSAHSLVRNALLYALCRRATLPRLLEDDWAYWPRPPAGQTR
jgi:glycosyltransferase involved in cell wall biosynthesis